MSSKSHILPTSMVPTRKGKKEKLIIPNKHGEKLVGLLHETGSKEIIILCHGFLCTKDSNAVMSLAVALANEGISAFRFDFSGNGESQGSLQYGRYWGEVDDLHAVTEYFSATNRVVSAIIGHSKGGDVVLLYAKKYGGVPTIVNISGRFELKKSIELHLGQDYKERIEKDGFIEEKKGKKTFRVTEENLVEFMTINMNELCALIDKECRVLTVHGSGDTIVPVEDAKEFDKIISNHKLHIIEGADHVYNKYQPELALVVLDFIKEAM